MEESVRCAHRLALERWRYYVDLVTRKRLHLNPSNRHSVRRFATFGILKTRYIGPDADENQHKWFSYSCPDFPEYCMQIRHLDENVQIEDLLGFNNTGNVCVWVSEEILTYYCLKNQDLFRNKDVCELGGGMTSLAGLAVASCTGANSVLLTDGNERSTGNLDVITSYNADLFNQTQVKARLLRWDKYEHYEDLKESFDYVIAADCLFFDEFRKDLVITLQIILKPQGKVVIFAPTRGKTFMDFAEMASDIFRVEIIENYDSHIWAMHQENEAKGIELYDKNLHYPLMMTLSKK